ncbi:hypothetical protein V500_00164 [Pseudogymnoascus sp. VKM F-4518 (FW-2643)]|nr:hypothetical protein V500_00164 [Pseudogymnoascus sp. VKM F-4518 (FW-2643)]
MVKFFRLRGLLPLLLLAVAGNSSVLPRFSDVNTVDLFGRDALPENSASCVPSCDLGTCGKAGSCSIGSAFSKRSTRLEDSFNTSSDYEDTHALRRRLFTNSAGSTTYSGGDVNPTRGELDAYIPAVDNGAEDDYFGPPLPTVEMNGDGIVDERAVSQQKSFGKDPFQIISTNVYGCTVIVVASKRGVWMTHLWESYSNGKIYFTDEAGERRFYNPDTLEDPAFDQRVLKFLKGETVDNPVPNGWNDYVAPTGPGIDVNLFNNGRTDQTSVYVFTPCKYGERKPSKACIKFPNRYGEYGEVHKTIAGIFDVRNPRWALVPYVPLNTEDPEESELLGTNNRGAVLFQYDPNSDGKGKKAWRLFLEKRFQYTAV